MDHERAFAVGGATVGHDADVRKVARQHPRDEVARRVIRERGIVGPESRAEADALRERVTRSARGVGAEVVCAALALAAVWRIVTGVLAEPHDHWVAVADGAGGSRLTVAGAWHAWVVHGVLFWLSLRWLWRFALWYRFLWGLSHAWDRALRPQALRVELSVEPGVPALLTDAALAEEILVELIQNAAKFTPRGGTITLAAVRGGGDTVALEVRDTGNGFAPDEG